MVRAAVGGDDVGQVVVVKVHGHCQGRSQQQTQPHQAVAIVPREISSEENSDQKLEVETMMALKADAAGDPMP